jgi:hypothetical protein
MNIKCNVDKVTCFNEPHAMSLQKGELNMMFVIDHEPQKVMIIVLHHSLKGALMKIVKGWFLLP